MLGLYIHWPFCLSKCPYCDFNSHVRRSFDEKAWMDSIISEIGRFVSLCGYENNKLDSIFFGGGTPSLISPYVIENIINYVKKIFRFDSNLEISLEANPNSVEVEKFKDLALSGVNRISLGIQSLKDADLKKLGRKHNAKEAVRAIEIAKKCFSNVSIDLIYARFDQSLKDWENELTMALDFSTNHMSLYQLTIEDGTSFANQYKRGVKLITDLETACDMYILTYNLMEKFGYKNYEISNYAKENFECRHNLVYWNYGDYIGVGAGAHGRITIDGKKFATEQIRSPEAWLKGISNKSKGDKSFDILTLENQMQEKLLMQARLSKGISLKDFNLDKTKIDQLVKEGLAEVDSENILKFTILGRLKLNSIIDYIIN